MSSPEEEPLLDIARGDPARSNVLRSSLEVLRDSSNDPKFRAVVDDILTGRASLREVARNPVFDRGVAEKAEAGFRWFHGLSEEERVRLAEEGRAQIEHVRVQRERQQESASDEDDDQGFDMRDPLRRRSQSVWLPRQEEASADDDEYEFDPDDPLRRRH